MAIIPLFDPTLQAVKAALQEEVNNEPPRTYLGMSGIGHKCYRKHWYDFRWASNRNFKKSAVLKIQDGNAGEEVMRERLELVPGVNVYCEESPGKQIEVKDINGHFKGHLDGIITGLLQAPKAQHVWEHKQVEETKFNRLKKLATANMKMALKNWDENYYSQAMMYCHYMKIERHYLTCATPGGRDFIGVRTDYDPKYALKLIGVAKMVIESSTPLSKFTHNPSMLECKFCDHADVCHNDKFSNVNCRTCVYSTPREEGEWTCDLQKTSIDKQSQLKACECHMFIPDLMPNSKPTDTGELWVSYRRQDGLDFTNGRDFIKSVDLVK